MNLNDRLLEKLRQEYGPEATETVIKTIGLFSVLIHVDRSSAKLLKTGVLRMAEVVNEMLPALRTKRQTRVYNYVDLDGALDPIPRRLQDAFVALIGSLMLNANDGPFQAATHLNDAIDQLRAAWSAQEEET